MLLSKFNFKICNFDRVVTFTKLNLGKSLKGGSRDLSSLCRSEIQDGRPGLWLAETFFDFFSTTAEWILTKLDRKQVINALYQICVFCADRKSKMAALASDWLKHFSTSSLQRLNGFWRNLTGSKSSTSSTKFVFFVPIGNPRWPPCPLIGWNIFIRPSSDGTFYGMVMSVRVSVRPSQFSALFFYMFWHFDLKFCIWLCFYECKIKFELGYGRIIIGRVMPLWLWKFVIIHSFPHFSHTCFDIFSWNLVYDFAVINIRSSSSVVIFVNFCWVMPLLNLEYWKYSFPHFSHTYFDIISWNLVYDFVVMNFRSSLSVINFRQFLFELWPIWT